MVALLPLLVARIRAEEALLRAQFGDAYEVYRGRTSRLIPRGILSVERLSSTTESVENAFFVTISCMPDVPIREVVCQNCSGRTIQRLSSLEPVIWLQAVSSEDGIYINYACPVCNKLTRSRVASEARILPDVNLTKFPDDLDLFIVFLKCSKTGCASPVILLAPVKTEVRDVDLIAHIHENWSIHGAACAKGYPPAHPYEVRIWRPVESKR